MSKKTSTKTNVFVPPTRILNVRKNIRQSELTVRLSELHFHPTGTHLR
jgi:hypothetical protein